MTNPSTALRVALAYFDAWTGHDLDTAMSYIADDIVCDAPAGRLEGAEAYRGFMAPFVGILTGSALIAAFGDEETAVVVYDTETVPVAPAASSLGAGAVPTVRSASSAQSAPAAECVRVVAGKITYSRFIFDRAPFQAARAAGD